MLSVIIDRYLNSLVAVRSTQTIKWYAKRLRPLAGLDLRLTTVQLTDLRRTYALLAARQDQYLNHPSGRAPLHKPLSPATLRGYVRAWRAFFNWCVDERLLPASPARKLELPQVPKQPPKAISRADLDRIVEAARLSSVRDYAIICVLADSACRAGGLRRAEISALMVNDFKPLLKTLNIKGKRNKQRELPANTTVATAIDDWLRIRGSQPGPLFCPINKSGALNTSHRLSAQSIYNIVIRRGAQAGVKDLSPHDFRRTFVGDLLEAGADISTVQQLAGHANVTTTQRYDRRGDKIKRHAVELLDVPYHQTK